MKIREIMEMKRIVKYESRLVSKHVDKNGNIIPLVKKNNSLRNIIKKKTTGE